MHWLSMLTPSGFHRCRSSVNFEEHDIFAWKCMCKKLTNAQILHDHDICPKKYFSRIMGSKCPYSPSPTPTLLAHVCPSPNHHSLLSLRTLSTINAKKNQNIIYDQCFCNNVWNHRSKKTRSKDSQSVRHVVKHSRCNIHRYILAQLHFKDTQTSCRQNTINTCVTWPIYVSLHFSIYASHVGEMRQCVVCFTWQ